MNRREFSIQMLAGAAAAPLATVVRAQGPREPVEGTDYVKLNQPLAIAPGRIEVIEFFWYGCPHCYAFEPALDAWQKKLPSDVAFRRVPVAFRPEYEPHQRIYFALDAMGLVPTMHGKVFYAIHRDRKRLDQAPEIFAWMQANGVDRDKFALEYNSFSVQSKVRAASKLAEDYKIDGVPAIGVHGRYYTSGALVGSNEGCLAVADSLIRRVRKG